jgi:hypothetical protein
MRYIEQNLGTTYLGETEITWISVKRVFDSEREKKKYKWERYQEVLKEKEEYGTG